MMVVGGHEDVRRCAAAPGGGEHRIAWIAGISNPTPVIPPGHDHHDVGSPTTGRVGAPEPAARTSPSPTNQSPRLPTPVGSLPPFPPRRGGPALRPTRHAGPGASHIPPRRLYVAMSPPAPIPLLPSSPPPSPKKKKDEGRAGTAPAVTVRASLGWEGFVQESWGPIRRGGPSGFAIFDVPSRYLDGPFCPNLDSLFFLRPRGDSVLAR